MTVWQTLPPAGAVTKSDIDQITQRFAEQDGVSGNAYRPLGCEQFQVDAAGQRGVEFGGADFVGKRTQVGFTSGSSRPSSSSCFSS